MNIQSNDIQQLDKKSQIIESAIELFVSRGFQHTSMALLSKESSIAIGTIYHYFQSKDQLIEETYLYVTRLFGSAIQFTPDESKLGLRERFDLLWIKSYAFYIEHPNYYYLKDALNYSPLISKEIMDNSRKYYQGVFDLIHEGIQNEVFTNGHPVAMCMWLYNTLITPVQLKLGDEMEMTESELKQFIDMSWKGIANE